MTAPDVDGEKLRIFEEAAAHFARVAAGTPSSADRDALAGWLLSDPRHADAYAKVEALWESAGEIPELKARGRKAARRPTRRDLGKGVVVLAAGYLGWRYLDAHPFAELQTGRGERRTFRLEDGSSLELAAETRLSKRFTANERRLVLHAGEAFFSVASDASRPFLVGVGTAEVRAIGTAFGVSFDGEDGRVVVTEHQVALDIGADGATIPAGSRATFEGARINAVEPDDGAAELSWRDGRLSFVRAPLGRVVAEVNRWREGRLVIVGPGLAERPVTLIAELSRLETVLPRLSSVLPIRFVSVTRWLTLILPRG